MKTRIQASALAALLCIAFTAELHAQGTAFSYEGRLNDGGSPAAGAYDFRFTLYDADTGGNVLGMPLTESAVGVTNGLFTVTLDFGDQFPGADRWLQIDVRTNDPSNIKPFNPLNPRQKLLPTPYAITAANLAGTPAFASGLNLPGLTATIFQGMDTLLFSDETHSNLFLGPGAGTATASGGLNTANGYYALSADTAGSYNTACGADALNDNSTGNFNTASGSFALFANTLGSFNSAFGGDALDDNTTGGFNTAIGYGALYFNIDGNNNVANGNMALYSNTSGSHNTAVGDEALYSNIDGSNNVANGSFALHSNTNGIYNTANGAGAMLQNTSGSYNAANGYDALRDNIIGSNNVANGAEALWYNTTGSDNAANGYRALFSNTSGFDNTANGYLALQSCGGTGNTVNGAYALQANTLGEENTVNGAYAATANILGNYNTAIGANSLQSASSSDNIALGFAAGSGITSGGNNIDIGNDGLSTDTNVIRIGTSGVQTATYLVGNVYTPSGTVQMTSDRNIKENFAPVNPEAVLAKVAALPVTEWNYKTDNKGVQHIGPVAQDFHAAFGLNGRDDKHISVIDEGGVALAAIQGLNERLQQESKAKDAEIQQLQQTVAQLKDLVNQLADQRKGNAP